MGISRSPSYRSLRAGLLGASLFATVAGSSVAHAWDAEISLNNFGVAFYVESWSGSYLWSSVREGVSTAYGLNGGVPNAYLFQDWSGTAWPSLDFSNEVLLPANAGNMFGTWNRDGAASSYEVPELADYAYAYISGVASGGVSMGSQIAYDFDFTLDPFSEATIAYEDSDALAYVKSEAGEEGVAFAGVQLYSVDIDANEPGGANAEYFEEFIALSGSPAGGESSEYLSGLRHTFSNLTADPVTYHLRLEGYAFAFTTPVPEPEAYAMMLAGLGLVALAARRRRSV